MAALVVRNPYGILNRAFLPYSVRFVMSILLLDLIRYFRHYLYHSTALGWRIHQVHHSDPDFDVTTALRFHPFEDLFTGVTDIAVVALLAPPPLAVACGEAIAVVSNLLIHANARLPRPLEALCSSFLVTPDLHRVHHSAEIAHQQSNFGVICSLWDRLFRTRLSASPTSFGIDHHPDPYVIHLPALLASPFRPRNN
jgi:sterol desaturase/sphingolipid hydroxylase (fatty acid hydroxylase superfamily)